MQTTQQRQQKYLTIPQVADRLGISTVEARRTCERGFFLDFVWVGRQRAVPVGNIDAFRAAAAAAGYKPRE